MLLLVACGDSGSQAEAVRTEISQGQPSTETTAPASDELSDTDPGQVQSAESVVYYYFVESDGDDLPGGCVVVLPDILILAPTQSDITSEADPVANISSALQAMVDDPFNKWTTDGLEITSIMLDEGHTSVALDGEVTGAGDIVLVAFRMQVLLTVFAESSVESATVTLNGECIGNLGISHESEIKPADYIYTRADIEVFISDDVPEMK